MKKLFEREIWTLSLTFLLVNLLITNVSAQTGITLEQALNIAESNSPTMKKTRLDLIRNQENLNA